MSTLMRKSPFGKNLDFRLIGLYTDITVPHTHHQHDDFVVSFHADLFFLSVSFPHISLITIGATTFDWYGYKLGGSSTLS